MIKKSWVVTGLALLATLTLTTACNREGATSAGGKTGLQALSEAAAKTKDQSFKFTLTYGALLTADGTQDAAAGNASVNMNVDQPTSGIKLKINALILGPDTYLKMDFGALGAAIPGLTDVGDRWMHVDTPKLAGSAMSLGLKTGSDSVGVDNYIRGVVTAEQVSATEIKGTLDLTKSAPPGTTGENLGALGDAGKNVPFTATLDDQGRVSKIVIKMPKVGAYPASDLITTYADYGVPVELAKPAPTEVVEAPAMIFQFLQ
ncbi:MAG: hypothetical protein ACM30G_13965 [Micromonosporaceae bacterium]